jgi:hypothetical protein
MCSSLKKRVIFSANIVKLLEMAVFYFRIWQCFTSDFGKDSKIQGFKDSKIQRIKNLASMYWAKVKNEKPRVSRGNHQQISNPAKAGINQRINLPGFVSTVC